MYGIDDRATVRKQTRKRLRGLKRLAASIPSAYDLEHFLASDPALADDPTLKAAVRKQIVKLEPRLGV